MKKTLLAGLIGAAPLLTLAAEAQPGMQEMQQRLEAMQREIDSLKTALQQSVTARQDSDEALTQQVSATAMKVDKLSEDAQNGPIAGLSISGYIDPLYSSNLGRKSASFVFANRSQSYNYDTSNLGDVYLDIKKTFGSGPLAPYVDITIMPDRGAGVYSSLDSNGNGNMSILNSAQAVVPLDEHWQVFAGDIPSWAGYEYAASNQTVNITHNLLYDFSEPSNIVGAGASWVQGAWSVKAMLGNEAGRSQASQVNNAANRTPSLSWRVDNMLTNNIDIGWYGYLARGTSGNYTGSTPNFGRVAYTEVDISNTQLDDISAAQFDYGSAEYSALNGGRAQWWGFSLLKHHKFETAALGRMGWTVRYDYLNNSKNGGGNPSIGLSANGNDPINGFGVDPACYALDPSGCKGAVRQDITAALLFYPTDQLQLKLEARHDISSVRSFERADGTTSKHNDVLSAQAVYSF
ncbi:DUF3138 family protein [Vogesella sp. LIG4]|uniref:DUF3138 family protein n=1 Tax=Vogesella sp. LIG4 TaxID=1192162 RepID=UPI00081FF2F3|nr:DUF3138 family protein [Vogesella sp. LIG4]SCK29790.1 Protein of unknown function [Vogesella sp. LIG4]